MHHLVRFVSPVAIGLTTSLLGGCSLEKDDASEFREAVPEVASVSVDGPAADAASAAKQRTLAAGAGVGEPASWYVFTRNVRDGVNVVTAVVLGSVWFVVHTEPTELDTDRAVWGPYEGDALEPARYRFTVSRTDGDHFAYRLEGQAKSGGKNAPFLPVLEGDGYSRKSDRHGDGSFRIDLDNARQLDPSRHAGDSGSVTITHELPFEIGRKRDALPRTIVAELRPDGGEALDITSLAREDRTGELVISGTVDVDDSASRALEDVTVTSRWRATGAGRADVGIVGGDLVASGFESASFVECWGTDFSRVYYSDSVGLKESEGEVSDCAFEGPPGE